MYILKFQCKIRQLERENRNMFYQEEIVHFMRRRKLQEENNNKKEKQKNEKEKKYTQTKILTGLLFHYFEA